MTLVFPGLLALLLLGGAVAWAYLRRAPPRRARASSLLLLRMAAAAPSRQRRVEELWSLALLLLALLAVTLAVSVAATPPRPLVVVVDHSASMGAQLPSGSTPLDQARAALEDVLSDRPDAAVTLVTTPPLRTPVRGRVDAHAVRAAVAALQPAGPLIDPTLVVADACARLDNADLLVLSDSWTPPADLDCGAWQPNVGRVDNNAGLTALTARVADALGLVELHARVEGAPPLSVSVDGGPSQAISAPQGVFWLTLPAGGAVQVQTTTDPLLADNTATVSIPASTAVRATVVTTNPDGYAALALDTHPLVALTVVGPSDPIPESDLVVLEVAHADGLPQARRVLLLGAGLPDAGLSPTGTVRRPALVGAAGDPALRWSKLDDLFVERAQVLPLPSDARPLLTSDAGPVAVRLTRPEGDLLAFGFGLDDSDLGLRAAWLNLVANLVDEAAALPAALPASGLLSASESAPATVTPLPVPRVALASWPWALALLAVLALAAEAATAALLRRRRA